MKSFFSRYGLPLVVSLSSVVLMMSAFPPFKIPEVAYFLQIPFLLWCLKKPNWKLYTWTVFTSSWLGWVLVLIWLRHTTVIGLISLTAVLGSISTIWLIAARWHIPKLQENIFLIRLLGALSLSGLWVVLEWTKTWLLSGFPWLPLAASQWERPIVLQYAAYAGSYGVSFLLIYFNVAFTLYIAHLKRCSIHRLQKGPSAAYKSSTYLAPDLFLPIVLLIGSLFLYFKENKKLQFAEEIVNIQNLAKEKDSIVEEGQFKITNLSLRVGIVQPDVPALLKWDPELLAPQLDILKNLTYELSKNTIDIILWPEAATPEPALGNPWMQRWVEQLVHSVNIPLITGSLVLTQNPFEKIIWHNSVLIVFPQQGILPEYYSKQKCVPFGEYIPFKWMFPIIKRIVPVGDDVTCGQSPKILKIDIANQEIKIGCLICYEDIFPVIARKEAQAGADLFVVLTNDAWFGQEAGAYQHAAHSVLRAVETRRTFIRCGNAGWSGWIDEFGHIRQVMLNEKENIYFRGTDVLNIHFLKNKKNYQSFYVRHGDWFVALCALFAIIGIAALSRRS